MFCIDNDSFKEIESGQCSLLQGCHLDRSAVTYSIMLRNGWLPGRGLGKIFVGNQNPVGNYSSSEGLF